MITRIVKMEFREEAISEFIAVFRASSALIRSSAGCHELKLMKDAGNDLVYFTLSKWESQQHLDDYRLSEVFKTTWAKVKPLFSEKAKAWSLVDTVPV